MAGFINIYNTLELILDDCDDLNTIIKKIRDWLRDQKNFYWSVSFDNVSIHLSIDHDCCYELEPIVQQLAGFYSMCTKLDKNILICSSVVGYHIVCGSYVEFGAIYVDSTDKIIKTTGFRNYGKLIQSIINWK